MTCDKDECDWQYISDWSGDPGVIGGTYDCSYWECSVCGSHDNDDGPPSDDHNYENDY